jgi:hypothetical protein
MELLIILSALVIVAIARYTWHLINKEADKAPFYSNEDKRLKISHTADYSGRNIRIDMRD